MSSHESLMFGSFYQERKRGEVFPPDPGLEFGPDGEVRMFRFRVGFGDEFLHSPVLYLRSGEDDLSGLKVPSGNLGEVHPSFPPVEFRIDHPFRVVLDFRMVSRSPVSRFKGKDHQFIHPFGEGDGGGFLRGLVGWSGGVFHWSGIPVRRLCVCGGGSRHLLSNGFRGSLILFRGEEGDFREVDFLCHGQSPF